MVKAKLIIEVREDDKVYVTGPLDKKQLCIAMIEEARLAIQNHKKTSIIMPNLTDIKKN